MVGLQKFWQGGAVRIYNWNELQSSIDDQVDDIQNYDMEHGMISMIKGRTNAGHLGQSISFFENDLDKGIWIGEPMSERGKSIINTHCMSIGLTSVFFLDYRKW